jgi:hypothetical protein
VPKHGRVDFDQGRSSLAQNPNPAETEAGGLPSPQVMEAMGALAHHLQERSANGAAWPVCREQRAARWLAKVTVQSRDEALALATTIGEAIGGDLELEVGKVTEDWDVGLGEQPANAPLRYLILYKATAASEAGQTPLKRLTDQGSLLSSGLLMPSSRAKRLSWRGGSRTILDGPFSESKELIGGYVVLDLASLDECVAFAEILLTATDTLEIDLRPS